MSEKIKISAVSYLNTLPFIFGIESSKTFIDKIELSKDVPSVCAEKLINNEVDLGLIPVAEISKIKDPKIISGYCIGAIGKVHTVLLLSDVPKEEINKIYLDYQSRTSVNLIKILVKRYWKISPEFIEADKGYEDLIVGGTAGLIIGDRCFTYADKLKYVYDLSEEWMKFTDFPFVFAAWVANKEFPESFINEFNDTLKLGLDNKDFVIKEFKKNNPESQINIEKYLKTDISYSLDNEKRKGMDLFLKMLKSI